MLEQEIGMRALAEVQLAVLGLRSQLEANAATIDRFFMEEEWVPSVAESLQALDRYLTGKVDARREDSRGFMEMGMGLPYIAYLSDGGYSRLLLDPLQGVPVRLASGATAKVKERFNALLP